MAGEISLGRVPFASRTMMMSDSTFPQRFVKIDDLTRGDHWYLTEADECYFIGRIHRARGLRL